MAKLWIALLFGVVSIVGINCRVDPHVLNLKDPPLFDYTDNGHDVPDDFNNLKAINLNFNISYFGTSYNALYVSKDGTIGFEGEAKFIDGVFWYKGIPNAGADVPFIAPFYYQGYDPTSIGANQYQGKIYHHVMYAETKPVDEQDINYLQEKEVQEYLSYYIKEAVIGAPKDFVPKVVVIVTWDNVANLNLALHRKCLKTNQCESATFQAVIVADAKNTYVIFNYKSIGIEHRQYYQAGFNGGYERGWLSAIQCDGKCSFEDIDLSNTTVLNEMPNLQGSDLKGRFIYDVGGEDVARAGCLPPNLESGKLEVHPRNVRMFGGEKMQVSGKCLSATSKIYCMFGSPDNHYTTEGEMINGMRGYCPVPKMNFVGSTQVKWSDAQMGFNIEREISVVGPWSLLDLESQDSKAHLQSWFSKDSDSISVSWDPEVMSSNPNAIVEVRLIGYRETSSKVEFKELENLGQTKNSEGKYTFMTDKFACTKNCEDFRVGLLEVGLLKAYFAEASDMMAMRFGPMPLGWYVNKELSDKKGNDWPAKMCHTWHREDGKDKSWLNELPKCPCNVRQAVADFGRWQSDPDCDMYSGSRCVLQKGAKHCVRSMHPTSTGAGNQCCYFEDGSLMYRQLTFTAGGPTRKNIWGTAPYNRPGMIPGLSSAESDIIPYIHCCFWQDSDSDLCHEFTKLRPTTDCDMYEVPGLAIVRGHTHITTFDGSTYNFEGTGDYWLLKDKDISIQGRFEYRRESWDLGKLSGSASMKPTTLTHITIKGKGSADHVIRVHPAPATAAHSRGVDITVGNDKYFFLDQLTKFQEFGDASIINNAKEMKNNPHNNFTIIISQVGINVVAQNNLLHVTVVLPPSMKSSTEGRGLLGAFDGVHDNDYINRQGSIKSSEINPEILFKTFALTWAVKEEESLFALAKGGELYTNADQFYTYENIPHKFPTAPTDEAISNLCGKDDNCKWDYRVSGSPKIAKATKEADERFYALQGSAYKVENCGLPDIGDMAILSHHNFSAGRDITVTGCDGDHSFDGKKEFKCMMERMSDAKDKKRDDYGRRVTYNKADYIIHWVPEPYTICKEGSDSSTDVAMIAGIAAGVVLVIILIIVIIIIVKKRKGGSKNIQKPRPADRVRRDQDFDEGTDEPMMSDSRKPVYKGKDESRASSAV